MAESLLKSDTLPYTMETLNTDAKTPEGEAASKDAVEETHRRSSRQASPPLSVLELSIMTAETKLRELLEVAANIETSVNNPTIIRETRRELRLRVEYYEEMYGRICKSLEKTGGEKEKNDYKGNFLALYHESHSYLNALKKAYAAANEGSLCESMSAFTLSSNASSMSKKLDLQEKIEITKTKLDNIDMKNRIEKDLHKKELEREELTRLKEKLKVEEELKILKVQLGSEEKREEVMGSQFPQDSPRRRVADWVLSNQKVHNISSSNSNAEHQIEDLLSSAGRQIQPTDKKRVSWADLLNPETSEYEPSFDKNRS